MKIGRTNAIAISGGTTKTPYEEWQEGFGANWDSVIQNAPQTGVQPVLHIYSKVNSIRHISASPNDRTIVTYNPTTGIYRPITVDANKNLLFEEGDYFVNDNDELSYVCVIYKALGSWGNWVFRTTLPVVYSNTKFCTGIHWDNYICLINDPTYSLYPFLRGVDCYNPGDLHISALLEHLTVAVYQPLIYIRSVNGSDTQVRLLKEFVENAPVNTNFIVNSVQSFIVIVSDENLADWFYNDFVYNRFGGNNFIYGLQPTNIVRQFNIRPDIQFFGEKYLNQMPKCIYLNGLISEDVTNTTYAGLHGFNNGGWTMLQNFPMWKVLEGASTGCLLPIPQGSIANVYANFVFYSKNLERKYFCEFDENVTIIEDPTKYFLCNLPVQQYVTGQSVRFVTNAFWSLFTADEISEIERYIGLKNWAIIWQ